MIEKVKRSTVNGGLNTSGYYMAELCEGISVQLRPRISCTGENDMFFSSLKLR